MSEDADMDWLSDVPDIVWGAAATGTFLLAQLGITGRREKRRLELEREDRRDARRHELADKWREERREVYARALNLSREGMEALDHFTEMVEELASDSNEVEPDNVMNAVRRQMDASEQFAVLSADLSLIASDETSKAALRVGHALETAAERSLRYWSHNGVLHHSREAINNLYAKHDDVRNSRQHLLNLVRADLGTSSD